MIEFSVYYEMSYELLSLQHILVADHLVSCVTVLGKCTSNGLPEREGLSASRLKDLVHGSEYVLSYEDKDGDWMLVGDVPWE